MVQSRLEPISTMLTDVGIQPAMKYRAESPTSYPNAFRSVRHQLSYRHFLWMAWQRWLGLFLVVLLPSQGLALNRQAAQQPMQLVTKVELDHGSRRIPRNVPRAILRPAKHHRHQQIQT